MSAGEKFCDGNNPIQFSEWTENTVGKEENTGY